MSKNITAKQMLNRLLQNKYDVKGLKMTVDGKPITGLTLDPDTNELKIETGEPEPFDRTKDAKPAPPVHRPIPLPPFLHRNPEQVKDEADRQALLRASMPPPTINPERRISMQEQAIRNNLALMKPGDDGYDQTRKQLAEVLIEQGKFEEADQYDDSYKLGTRCDCPPDTVNAQVQTNRGPEVKAVEVPTEFVVKEAGGRKLIRCTKCETMWVGDADTADLSAIEKNQDPKFA